MFFCSISGEPPQDPVVSSKSGHVYERRLIQKYIAERGADPVTGEKLEETDLITVKANHKTATPRSPELTSVPVCLTALGDRWDEIALDKFMIKQQIGSVSRQLSNALYSQDAMAHVVTCTMVERNTAREYGALSNAQAIVGVAPAAASGEDVNMAQQTGEPDGLPKKYLSQIIETREILSASRKQHKARSHSALTAQVRTYIATSTIPSLHSSCPSGITSISVSSATPGLFATGGNDNIVQLYDRGTDQLVALLRGHTKKINQVTLHEPAGGSALLLSASVDKTARAWTFDVTSGQWAPCSTLEVHKGEVTGVRAHPTGTLIALSSLDRTYSLHDRTTLRLVFRSVPGSDVYTALAVHPDGELIALGTPTSAVQIFDVRTGMAAATLQPEGGVPFTVGSLSFSENGYHLIAPDSPSSVAVWDLRRQTRGHTIALGHSFRVNKVLYDRSAQFFAIGGNEGVRVFAYRTWAEVVRFEEVGDVSDLAFDDLSEEMWGVTGRDVRTWGVPGAP